MSTILKISVDTTTLLATLTINREDARVINELRILFTILSDDYLYRDKSFRIPWFELRRGLIDIARLCKREQINVQYDDFARSLLFEVVQDRKSLKEKYSPIEINESEFIHILDECGFHRSLKEEQKRDALYLLRLKHGANFSVPGAGKTTTILAVHSVLRRRNLVSKLFVIAPINAFISWQDEIEEIYKPGHLKVIRLNRNSIENYTLLEELEADVILVNYEKLRNNVSQLIHFFIKHNIHLVLDESHRIKSGMSNLSYGQIIKLADLAKRRDILSGTPMPQCYTDLEPQFDYLWPGMRVIPEKITTDDNQQLIIKVNEYIKDLYVRTTKNELGLDDPIIEYKILPMGKIQAELYRLFKSESARLLSGMDKPNIHNFRRIGRSVVRLLQAATNPMLLTAKEECEEEILPVPENMEFWELLEDFQKYEKSAKIEYLVNRVGEIIKANKNNKVLVWSYFVRNILILERLLLNFNPVIIYGGVHSGDASDKDSREGRIRKFHEDSTCKVMIANPQACGEGISLHKVCHSAIYLDRNFNAAYFLQSIDRIHRLGLEEGIETRIEILISENTIDELLISRLNDKIGAMGSILEDHYLQSLAYDPADIPIEEEHGINNMDFIAIKDHVGIK